MDVVGGGPYHKGRQNVGNRNLSKDCLLRHLRMYTGMWSGYTRTWKAVLTIISVTLAALSFAVVHVPIVCRWM